jgi:signal transduction histidine kinase
MPLVMAWACVLLAALAVAVLVKGAVSLSERRAAFVSAVTHELRTPLTTFRLYTEMLEEGRVSGEERRRQYLVTLHAEAERLCHLVDNVLAYARLERGRPGGQLESVNLRDFLAQVADRLSDRAGQAGMHLVVRDAQCAGTSSPRPPDNVQADASAVEQILLNLVDNACKYAACAEDRAIEIDAAIAPPWATIRVRDHGPGLSADERRVLFKPFHKSARRAAESAPGVGLGLSLSRRLARDMGGDLRLDESVTSGACFVLTLRAG